MAPAVAMVFLRTRFTGLFTLYTVAVQYLVVGFRSGLGIPRLRLGVRSRLFQSYKICLTYPMKYGAGPKVLIKRRLWPATGDNVIISISRFSLLTRFSGIATGVPSSLVSIKRTCLVDLIGVPVTDPSICSFFVVMFAASGSVEETHYFKDITLLLRFLSSNLFPLSILRSSNKINLRQRRRKKISRMRLNQSIKNDPIKCLDHFLKRDPRIRNSTHLPHHTKACHVGPQLGGIFTAQSAGNGFLCDGHVVLAPTWYSLTAGALLLSLGVG